MRRFLPLALALALAPLLLAADAPSDLAKQVRALEPLVEKARGLKFKKPVAVRVAAARQGRSRPASTPTTTSRRRKSSSTTTSRAATSRASSSTNWSTPSRTSTST